MGHRPEIEVAAMDDRPELKAPGYKMKARSSGLGVCGASGMQGQQMPGAQIERGWTRSVVFRLGDRPELKAPGYEMEARSGGLGVQTVRVRPRLSASHFLPGGLSTR